MAMAVMAVVTVLAAVTVAAMTVMTVLAAMTVMKSRADGGPRPRAESRIIAPGK